jgi:pantoate--beta-alanine ligase
LNKHAAKIQILNQILECFLRFSLFIANKRKIAKNKYLCAKLFIGKHMLIFKKVTDLQHYLTKVRQKGQTIGFAPTMGALHRGHASLVERANKGSNISVVSIFVNPTQFNDPKDLVKYPRTPERDIELLIDSGCDILFMPDIEEIYPNGTTPSVKFNFGKLDKVLEGVFRPGHFDGMAQVVHRLLDIIKPNKLYMGQKDFQQFAIVESLIKQMKLNSELHMCPILREEDGLAMSSRNVRLSPEDRQKATLINKVLKEASDMVGEYSPSEIQKISVNKLRAEPRFRLEYFEIVDGRTLLPIHLFEDTDYAVALTAVFIGDVRLIDNMILKQHFTMEEDEQE